MGRDDVVAQGPEPDRPGRAPRRYVRVAAGLAVLLAVAGVSRSGLLSADEQPTPPTTLAGPVPVARLGNHLLIGQDGGPRTGSTLPARLPASAPLVPVRLAVGSPPLASEGPGPLIGVRDGLLFRVDPDRPRWRPMGRADAVVSAALAPSRVLVHRGAAVEELEVGTGSVTVERPFPGFDARRWTPVGLLAAAGSAGLVMSRPGAGGEQVLALAWPDDLVSTRTEPAVEPLGSFGPLLAIADDWAVSLQPDCPGPDCLLRVVSVTRDQVTSRTIAPPAGWTFRAGPSAGRTHETLVPVEHLSQGRPDGTRALARLVPGGENALLVRGTDRVVLRGGLADGPQGTVYLLTDPAGHGDPQVRVWDPERPDRARLVAPRSTFPRGARLVCVCG